MSPLEIAVRGPERATTADIERVNRLFSEAFADRYQRDGMTGVRVPLLNPAIWRFALATAGEDALVWREPGGGIIAFNMIHRSGQEGWMGPLAVRPDRQGEGLGQVIVRAGIERLTLAGARTIGLETMPRTVDNIGFYSRLGFRPGHLTVSMVREVEPAGAGAADRLGRRRGELERGLDECMALTERLVPGVDFSRELRCTLDQRLGDATLVRGGRGLAGFAVWHSAPLAEGRGADEVRILKLVAHEPAAFRQLIAGVESHAAEERVRRVSVRCQTRHAEAYTALLDLGYRVHWTDLRMTLEGHGELIPTGGGIVFSNWEI